MAEPTIECQECGDVIRYLAAAEAQQVARNPYNFIMFCRSCQQDQKRLERFRDYE